MWDQFREEEENKPFFQDETPGFVEEAPAKPKKSGLNFTKEPILGMTPVQRFLLSFMLFVVVCLLGTMFMIVTEKFFLF